MLKKWSLNDNHADNSFVPSIHSVQSNKYFGSNDHDQLNKEPYTDNITLSYCSGEESCVTNSLSNISTGGNIFENDYNDKETMSQTISINCNDDNTSNNKLENNINDNTCFESNHSDNYCTYR